MYTDSSKSQAGVGASVICNNIKPIYKLPNICSIFTTESFVILKGIQLVIDTNIPKAIIFSDSISAINNIINAHNNNHIGTKFVTIRNSIRKHCSVMLDTWSFWYHRK